MTCRPFQAPTAIARSLSLNAIVVIANCALPTWASAQNALDPSASHATGWQQCSALSTDSEARLRCFDQWAARQQPTQAVSSPPASANALATRTDGAPSRRVPTAAAPVVITMEAPEAHNCKNPRFSELSRFWELEAGSDCGTFGIRGYQPISLSVLAADSVNTQPSSPSAEHTAASVTPFGTAETRIGLSVRTKIAQGFLTQNDPLKRDSLWFGYSQQSNWQLFSGDLSRPFRTTDHEPELIYIYPFDATLPGGWRLRYGGISLNHQSNGQALPLSRSWNRTILMAGMENGEQFRVQAKLWQRVPEDAADDDNPDIADLVGRAEVTGFWNVDTGNTLGLTLRHSLRAQANGSFKLEWLKKLGDSGPRGNHSGLRFHTQLFSGYGDSLVDYNRRRTVFSMGLSLVDW
jgi:phospholipase A1